MEAPRKTVWQVGRNRVPVYVIREADRRWAVNTGWHREHRWGHFRTMRDAFGFARAVVDRRAFVCDEGARMIVDPAHNKTLEPAQVNLRRTLTVALATAAVALAPGIANAVPGEPGQCTGAGVCQVEPVSNGNLDGAFVVQPDPSGWDEFRAIAGKALADFVWGPVW